MIYGIILIVLYIASVAYNLYISRTPEAYRQFHKKESERADNNLVHYIRYALVAALNASIVGYLIYAVTCL